MPVTTGCRSHSLLTTFESGKRLATPRPAPHGTPAPDLSPAPSQVSRLRDASAWLTAGRTCPAPPAGQLKFRRESAVTALREYLEFVDVHFGQVRPFDFVPGHLRFPVFRVPFPVRGFGVDCPKLGISSIHGHCGGSATRFRPSLG